MQNLYFYSVNHFILRFVRGLGPWPFHAARRTSSVAAAAAAAAVAAEAVAAAAAETAGQRPAHQRCRLGCGVACACELRANCLYGPPVASPTSSSELGHVTGGRRGFLNWRSVPINKSPI